MRKSKPSNTALGFLSRSIKGTHPLPLAWTIGQSFVSNAVSGLTSEQPTRALHERQPDWTTLSDLKRPNNHPLNERSFCNNLQGPCPASGPDLASEYRGQPEREVCSARLQRSRRTEEVSPGPKPRSRLRSEWQVDRLRIPRRRPVSHGARQEHGAPLCDARRR